MGDVLREHALTESKGEPKKRGLRTGALNWAYAAVASLTRQQTADHEKRHCRQRPRVHQLTRPGHTKRQQNICSAKALCLGGSSAASSPAEAAS